MSDDTIVPAADDAATHTDVTHTEETHPVEVPADHKEPVTTPEHAEEAPVAPTAE